MGAGIYLIRMGCGNVLSRPTRTTVWKPPSISKFRGSPSEGHNPPRGSPRKFASQRVFRGLCGGLFEGSAGSLRGSVGGLRGSAGFSEGSDPILVTLGNC